ncbi:unnamed protein product, partial [Larinioides sclopetarius]
MSSLPKNGLLKSNGVLFYLIENYRIRKMGSCVAFNCINRCSKKIPGTTFHRFPKDETLKNVWVKAIRRANWVPSKFSRLCSKHFPEEMIDRTSLSCVRLRENAVPSIFDCPSHLQKVVRLRKLPTRAVFEPAQ